MFKQKKIWTDPSFWVLLATNGYLVYYYYQRPGIFPTLLWLYWAQSLMLGAFNVLDMLTVRKVNTHERVVVNGKPTTTLFTGRVASAMFFAIHFGFFHLVYFFFLYTMSKPTLIQWDFFKYFLYIFLAGQIIGFIQHKVRQWKEETSLGTMMALPYLRIVPMHLTIIFSGFFSIGGLGVFLILKTISDVAMYIATKPAATDKSREADAATLAAQQNMNLNA